MTRSVKYEAPKDFEELYLLYNDYARAVLAKVGIDQSEIPDEAHNLLLKFYENGGIGWYDGSKEWRIGTVNGAKVTLKQDEEPPEGFVLTGTRTAPFMSIFKSWIFKSALAVRDRHRTRLRREQCTAFGAQDEQGFEPVAESGVVENAELTMAVGEARTHLTGRVVAGVDLGALFRRVEQMYEEDGVLDREVLASEFGVTKPVLARRMGDMRRELAGLGLGPSTVSKRVVAA